MNAASKQSICGIILLVGCVLVGLGGWGIYSSSTREKTVSAPQPEEKKIEPTVTPPVVAKEPAANPPPTASPQPAVVKSKPTATPTPALITYVEPKSTPAPASPTPSTPPKKGRTLTEKQRHDIVTALEKYSGKAITISAIESDTESVEFAGVLKTIFVEAGWHVEGITSAAATSHPVGLNLAAGTFPSPDRLIAAYRALTSAGFAVSQQLDSTLTGGQAKLIVGTLQ